MARSSIWLWVIAASLFRFFGPTVVFAQDIQTPTATNIAQVCQAKNTTINAQLHAVVCWVNSTSDQAVIQDDSGAVWVEFPGKTFKLGQAIVVSGPCIVYANRMRAAALVDNDGRHGARESSGTRFFKAGRHPIRLAWFDYIGDEILDVLYEGPGIEKQKIPDSVLFRVAVPSNRTSWLPGLDYRCFEGSWEWLPDFNKMEAKTSGTVSNFDISVQSRKGSVGIQFEGFIDLPRDGTYRFYTSSDDGSKLWIGGAELQIDIVGENQLSLDKIVPGAPAASSRWGEAEGVVTFVSQNGMGTLVELESKQGRMKAQVFETSAEELSRYLGKRVCVRGLAEPTIDEQGQSVAGSLTVPQRQFIGLAKPPSSEWAAFPKFEIRSLTGVRVGVPKKHVIEYALTSANDYQVRDPRDWKLLASNDGGTNWVLLDRRVNESFENRFQRKAYSITNENAFNIYRLEIDATPAPKNGTATYQEQMVQLSEIELIGPSDAERAFEADTQKSITAAGEFPPTETKEAAFDGKTITKWLDRNTNSWIQVQYEWVSIPPNRVVKVTGRVVETGSNCFVLSDGEARLTVDRFREPMVSVGQELTVAGFLDRTGAGLVMSGAYIAGNKEFEADQTASSTTPNVLTNSAQVLSLNREEQKQHPAVRLRGVVTCYIDTGERDYLGNFKTIQDSQGGIGMQWHWDGSRTPGEVVEIEGTVDAWAKAPVIFGDRTTILGTGNMPAPVHPSWETLRTGELENQWIEVRGVVRSTSTNRIRLKVKGGELDARITPCDPEVAAKWVDALVSVRGVYHPVFSRRFQMPSFLLETPGVEHVQVEKMPPSDPFASPVYPISDVLLVNPPDQLPHRVKVEAVITYCDSRTCYALDRSGVVGVRLAEPAPLAPGDQVELVGFPEPGEQIPMLVETLVRKKGTTSVPPAVGLSITNLAMGSREGQRITLEGSLLAQSTIGPDQVLEILSERQTFRALSATNNGAIASIRAGSKVKATGVCKVESSSRRGGQRGGNFVLLMNGPADLVVVEHAPWWTWKHTAGVIVVMCIVLGAAFAWIRTLRNTVEQKTSALKNEIEEHKSTELQLEEKTRLLQGEIDERKRLEQEKDRIHRELLDTSRRAGMAEVASGVLHNVGNVLNSVNVAAGVVSEKIQASKAANIGKVVAILKEHADDLGTFLTQDAKGQKVPAYLAALADAIKAEQSDLQKELTQLRQNIEHIKEIVAMQQMYGRVSGVSETISVQELVEDALKLHSGSYLRHSITLCRDYAETPAIVTEKHKVLQILVNLFQNAKRACDESGRSDKQVIVKVMSASAEKVHIQVSDNGVGIPAENLTRIFNHGFTTRKDGHGFGLHSGALTAKELGGKLFVQSDGHGTGATFTLELPLSNGPKSKV